MTQTMFQQTQQFPYIMKWVTGTVDANGNFKDLAPSNAIANQAALASQCMAGTPCHPKFQLNPDVVTAINTFVTTTHHQVARRHLHGPSRRGRRRARLRRLIPHGATDTERRCTGTLTPWPAESRIDPRMRVLYLLSVAAGVFVFHRLDVVAASRRRQAVLWLVVGLGPKRLVRQITKLWFFTLFIVASYALTSEDPAHRPVGARARAAPGRCA